jgi:hypothetical protein
LNEYVVNIGSLLFIIAGLTSLLFFVKGRGFVFLGTGFLLLGVGTVVNHYLPQILDFERSSDAFQLSVTSLLIISSVVSSILMLGGLLFLYKDFRKNA